MSWVRGRLSPWAATMALAMAACGSGGGTVGGGTSLPPTTGSAVLAITQTPTPQTETLFAVLEAHGGGSGFPLRDDTVAIVGLDGYARAKATFRPRSVPFIGNAAPVLAPEAHVAGGAVFYADGEGTVRRLGVDGTQTVVTRFPVTSSQQQLAFAVSPDGAHLAASIFTYPPKASDQPGCGLGCPFFAPGAMRNDILTADAGGAAAVVRHDEYAQDAPLDHVPEVVGWDAQGPLMSIDAVLGTQQGTFGRTWFGHIAHMDGSGRPTTPLGGADCEAWMESDSGAVACYGTSQPQHIAVRSGTGRPMWDWALPEQTFPQGLALSPMGTVVAVGAVGSPGVTGRLRAVDGSTATLPRDFSPQGWLDGATVIGITVNGNEVQGRMGLVRTASPAALDDLGFSGSFVGVVSLGAPG